MAKTAKVTVIIDDNGTMRLTEASAKKLGKSLDNVSKSTHDVDRGMRGTAQMSSNATKNFSKQSQMVGGVLVPAYATLAAQIFALTAVFRFFQSAADLRVLEEGQLSYARQTGTSLAAITSSLQAATQGQLAFRDAAQAASIGVSAGLTANQLQRLSTVATKASSALGRDLTDSFNRLIRGAIKAEPELLDELGIIVRLEEAATDYGRAIGKTASELTTFEKSQAVVNAVITQGEDKFGKFEVKVNQVNRAAKSFNDLLISIQESLAPFVELLATAISQSGLFAAAIGGFAFAGPLKQLFPQAKVGSDVVPTKQDIGRKIVGAGYTGSLQEKFATGLFSSKDLDALDKSVNAAKSSVIATGKEGQEAIKKLSSQARASVRLDALESEKYWTKFTESTKIKFDMLKGSMVGSFAGIRAAGVLAGAAITTAFSVILSVAAWAGIIFLVGQLTLEWFKSTKALNEYVKKSDEASGALMKQADSVREISKELKKFEGSSADASQRLSALAGSMSFDTESILPKEMPRELKESTGFFDSIIDSFQRGFFRKDELNIRQTQISGLTKNIVEYNNALNASGKGSTVAGQKIKRELAGALQVLSAAMKPDATLKQIKAAENLRIELEEKGVAAFGKTSNALEELKLKTESAKKSSVEFTNSISEMANSLNKNDAFKSRRDAIKNIIGALQSELSFNGNNQMISSDLQSTIFSVLGSEMQSINSRFKKDVTKFNKAIGDALDSLLAKYQNFYDNQLSREIELGQIQNDRISNLATGVESKILANNLSLREKEKNILKERDKLQIDFYELLKNQNSSSSIQSDHLSKQIDLLDQRLEREKTLTDFLNLQLRIADDLAIIQLNSTIKTNSLKAKQLMIDKKQYGSNVLSAKADIESSRQAQELNRETISYYQNLQKNNTKLTDDQERQLRLALSMVDVLEAQTYSQELGLFYLEREIDLREKAMALSVQSAGIAGARTAINFAIMPSRQKEEALAQLQRQELLLNAEQKILDSKRDGIMPLEKQRLELEAANLRMEADLVELRLSRSYQLSQELLKETEAGMTNVLQAAFMGESVGNAALMFIQSFAKALNDAVTKALVDAMMTSEAGKGIMGGIMSIGSSLFGGGARYGGMFTQARYGMMPAYAEGGVSRGRDSGYPVMLHGTEAVVPLQDGKNIPVKMTGNSGNTNNVSVNVTVANGQATTQVSSKDSELRARAFGQALSEAVKQEIIIQSREGGLLNRI